MCSTAASSVSINALSTASSSPSMVTAMSLPPLAATSRAMRVLLRSTLLSGMRRNPITVACRRSPITAMSREARRSSETRLELSAPAARRRTRWPSPSPATSRSPMRSRKPSISASGTRRLLRLDSLEVWRALAGSLAGDGLAGPGGAAAGTSGWLLAGGGLPQRPRARVLGR